MNKRDFPKIHFYDQDFVDIYDKSWNWLADYWIDPATGEPSSDGLFVYPMHDLYILDQAEAIFSSFFLVYSNRNYPANKNIDYFYERQEESGGFACHYRSETHSHHYSISLGRLYYPGRNPFQDWSRGYCLHPCGRE